MKLSLIQTKGDLTYNSKAKSYSFKNLVNIHRREKFRQIKNMLQQSNWVLTSASVIFLIPVTLKTNAVIIYKNRGKVYSNCTTHISQWFLYNFYTSSVLKHLLQIQMQIPNVASLSHSDTILHSYKLFLYFNNIQHTEKSFMWKL